jgi:1-acyl-sn-glycerol-3-phosphate acyltransferase
LLILRSVAFNFLFYLNLILHVIGAIPTYALPRRAFMAMAKSWGYTSNRLLRAVAGTTVELRGLEKIPPGRAARRREASVGVGDVHAAHAVR